MKRLLLFFALSALTALAADITGTWKGSADTPMGTVERTFTFKVDGDKLTGETSSNMFGKSTIENGKVDGDNISFSITINIQGNQAKANYTGKVEGDQIKLKVEVPDYGQTTEYTVKRVSE